MKFLKQEVDKLINHSIIYISDNKEDLTDTWLKEVLYNILKNSQNWKNKTKKEWRDTINNKEYGWEEKEFQAIRLLKKIISKIIEKNNKEKDEREVENLIQNLLLKNEDKRFKSRHLRTELEKLSNNQFNNYNLLQTRQLVYKVIANMRKQFREEKFENGYIVSKQVLKNSNDDVNKIDGWLYTKDKDLIKQYFLDEISEHKKAVDNFSEYLLNL